jgi:hypothetical protein
MKTFKHYNRLEWKRFFSRRNTILLILFAFFALYFVQVAVNTYKAIVRNNVAVAKYEQMCATYFVRYEVYAAFGVELNLTPPPISIFFDGSGLSKELTAKINGGQTIDISVSLKGKNAFLELPLAFAGFSGWLTSVGSLIILILGFGCLRNTGYVKFQSSLSSSREVYLYTVISRLSVVFVISTAIIGLAILQVVLNGIRLSGGDYLQLARFLVVWFGASTLYFFLGLFLGTIRLKTVSKAAVLTVWLVLIFIGPLVVKSFVNTQSVKMPSNVALSLRKWEHLRDAEDRFTKRFGQFKNEMRNDEEVKDFVKGFFNNEFKGMGVIEDDLQYQFNRNKKLFHGLSIFLPSTYLKSVAREMSGKGFKSVAEFHEYLQSFKMKFFKFFFNKKYESDDVKTESFVKGTENIFNSKSHLPDFFTEGIILNLLYIAVLCFFSYRNYNHILYRVREKDTPAIKSEIDIKKGSCGTYMTGDRPAAKILFSILSGKSREVDLKLLEGEFCIDGRKVEPDTLNYEGRFLYICPASELPGDIKVKDFLRFVCGVMAVDGESQKIVFERPEIFPHLDKYLGQIEIEERSWLLLVLPMLKRFELYLFHDIARGMPFDLSVRLLDVMETTAAAGDTSIYLARDRHIEPSNKLYYLVKDPFWIELIKDWKTKYKKTGG